MSKKDRVMFKVRYGFNTTATLTIEAGPDLERAIYAWIEQLPVTIGDKMIQGKYIISIEPDYHYYTGWHETYSPKSGEDFRQIERDCPKFDGFIDAYKHRVVSLIKSGQSDKIGLGAPIPVERIAESKEVSTYAKQLTSQSDSQ